MATLRYFSAALLVAAVSTLAGLAGTACSADVTDQTSASAVDESGDSGQTSESAVGTQLFDDSTLHTVNVSFDQDDYNKLIETYKSENEKEWVEATVTIDGTTFEHVGIRLKGNSSLRGLANGREVGPGGSVSADDPQKLPWLIRLDKYVEDQSCDGVTDLVVRSSNWQTALNEAVALDLLDEAGLASERAIYVRFTVNESDATLRLCVELPEDTWMASNFSSDGALYKAEATGDYSYRGTDPEAYDEIFDQEAGKDNTDLTPLIEFLDFINNADDDSFVDDIGGLVDLDSMATYLAMEDLIANTDDIDGPGNNSYLYYDPSTESFTIVPWDHNLAFGGMDGARGADARPDRTELRNGAAPGTTPGAAPEAGETPVAPGAVAPEAAPNATPDQAAAADTRGPRNKENVLVERLKSDTEFQALYQERLAQLKTRLYESDTAADILAKWVRLLKAQASDLVDSATVDAEAAKIAAYFES